MVEGIVSLLAGAAAGSAALVGFGLDSFVESLSGGVMVWRFWPWQGFAISRSRTREAEQRVERRAVLLVGITFFILAVYVIFQSAEKLVTQTPPEPSRFGILIAAVSLVAMPALFLAKRRVARRAGSRSLAADSKQTLACAILSLALLAGLGLNYLFGLWQADPVVGLAIGGWLVKEGITTLRERKLCSC